MPTQLDSPDVSVSPAPASASTNELAFQLDGDDVLTARLQVVANASRVASPTPKRVGELHLEFAVNEDWLLEVDTTLESISGTASLGARSPVPPDESRELSLHVDSDEMVWVHLGITANTPIPPRPRPRPVGSIHFEHPVTPRLKLQAVIGVDRAVTNTPLVAGPRPPR